MANNIAVALTANADAFLAGLNKADSGLSKFEASLGKIKYAAAGFLAVIGADRMIGFAKSAIDTADALQDLSERTGSSVEELSALRLVADQNGSSLEAVAKGFKAFSKNQLEANIGSADTRAIFDAMGVSGNNALESLIKVSDQFAAMPDGMQKSALAQKLFGKSGDEMIPILNQGSAALREQIDWAQKHAAITMESAKKASEFNDMVGRLKIQFDNFALTIAGPVIESLTKMFAEIEKGIKHFGTLGNAMVNLGLSNPFKSTQEHIADLRSEIKALEDQIVAIDAKRASPGYLEKKLGQLATAKAKLAYYTDQQTQSAIAPSMPKNALPDIVVTAQKPKYKEVFSGEDFPIAGMRNYKKMSGFSFVTSDDSTAKFIKDQFATENAMRTEALAEMEKQKKESDDWMQAEQDSFLSTYNETIAQAYDWQQSEATRAIAAMVAAEEDRRNRLGVIQSEVAAGIKTESDARDAALGVNKESLSVFNAQMQSLEALSQQGFPEAADAIKKFRSTLIDLQDQAKDKTWIDGISQGLNDYAGKFNDTFSSTRDAVKNTFKGMEDALVSFVQTGKLNFKSLGNSIIADLIRIQIQSNITKPLAIAMGGISFSSLKFWANGGIPGGDGISAFRNKVVDRPTLFAFASGAGLMGEAGPEAIMPLTRRGGRLGVDASGVSPTINIEINNNAAQQVQARVERHQGPQGTTLSIQIDQIEAAIARNVARGRGALSNVLGGQYGLNRAAGAV